MRGVLVMKKLISIILITLVLLSICGCAAKEVTIVETYEVTDAELVEEYFDKGEYVNMVKHYKMSDGTWKTDNYTYKYRLEITGRMNAAVKDSTFVFLSNTKDITFDQAWKASGFSSNMADYFKEEDAKFVGWM